MSTNADYLFKNYLSDHLGHVSNQDAFRRRKKYIVTNYSRTFPEAKSARILDIGPGFGELLQILRIDEKFDNAIGIDISEEVVRTCNDLIPNSAVAVQNTGDFLAANRRSFDRIYMFHVLEHIPKGEIVDLLSAVRHALKPDGRFILEVPNMGNPFTGVTMRYADFTHEVGFTDTSLAQVLRLAGFSSVHVFGAKTPHYSVVRFIQAVVQKSVEAAALMLHRLYKPNHKPVVAYVLAAECSA
jgi:2-polyprenyl-3-methyl-5-hydroxy-6-metoxy-1,4-benzoquinol methylase